MNRLLELYRKTDGGQRALPEDELKEYSILRKLEYQTRKAELETLGKRNIRASKDAIGDIIGWVWEEPL